MFVAPGVTSAVVTWSTAPSATDVVDNVIDPATIQCINGAGVAVMSDQSYPVGTTAVTCTATDSASNSGTCQFDIAVEGMS